MQKLDVFLKKEALVFAVALLMSGFVEGVARAEATFMTGPKWFACNSKQICFSLAGRDASTSYFAPDRTFVRNVQFKLFSTGNRKTAQMTLVAKTAFSSNKEKTWYLQNTQGGRDYAFDTQTMILSRIAK